MIKQLLGFCLSQRLFVLGASIALLIAGIVAFERLPVQAFPDVQNVFVQIVTQYPGQAPVEVEKLVTLPIERQMSGLPHLSNLRSVSIFGLSVVTMTFDDDAEDYFSRQQVLERLQGVQLPASVQPSLGPLTTGVGEIYRYVLESSTLSLVEQRALQDWLIEPRLRTVQGVADVVGFGGGVKQYQIEVNPERLKDYKLSLDQVYQAVSANNGNTGGGYVEQGDEALVVRGVGFATSLDDLGDIVISSHDGVAVHVRDIASVAIGPQPRNGIVAYNTHDDIVQGIVLLLKGKDAISVLEQVRQIIAELNAHGLPPGVKIRPIYDRTELVQHTVHTVEHNMIEGAALIFVILFVFLRRGLASLTVILTIPLALLFAFVFINAFGISANLISLGAIDFGIIVDSAVVLVEAVMVKVTQELEQKASISHLRHAVADTAVEMGRPILFAKAIIITAFLPIFTFQQVEAKIFSPMAYTLSFALLGSLLITLTLIPVLLSYLLGPRLAERHNTLVAFMERHYQRILEWVLNHGRWVLGVALVLLLGSILVVRFIGTEFMPKLDEGNIWLTVTMPTPVSLTKAKAIEQSVRAKVREFPEVNYVLTQLGRPEDGTDPKGFNNLEVLVDLRDKASWRYRNKDELVLAMDRSISELPGIETNFSQVIQDNVEEAISGVKGEIAVKIFGDDLGVLQDKADQVNRILQATQGSTDVAAEQQSGLAQLVIEINRARIARYGINVADVEAVIETAIGGKTASQFLEGDRRFDIVVRIAEPFRNAVGVIEELTIPTPTGIRIPLGELATIKINQGAARITRENNQRRIAIKCNLIGRDQGSFVAEAQRKVAEQVELPPGYRIVWSGQFENQQRAMKRLYIIVPISLGLIFTLLFWAFHSVKYAALIVLNVPFAMIGGILILLATGIHLSISAAVGFIALFGIAVQNGVILVSQVKQLRDQGLDLHTALIGGCVNRLRPVVMTALMAMLGLFPAALSTGVGSETAKPFAVVIIGGLVTATILTLSLLPLLYRYFEEQTEE